MMHSPLIHNGNLTRKTIWLWPYIVMACICSPCNVWLWPCIVMACVDGPFIHIGSLRQIGQLGDRELAVVVRIELAHRVIPAVFAIEMRMGTGAGMGIGTGTGAGMGMGTGTGTGSSARPHPSTIPPARPVIYLSI